MDKRWIGIIIVLLAGLGCMYLVVSNSTSVGNAVSVISDVAVTLPPGYITTDDGSRYCVFHNKKTNEVIRIICLEEVTNNNEEYNKKLKSLTQQDDIIIKKNFTNKNLSMIEYENQSSKDEKDNAIAYFDKCNHTFSMKLEHFTNETSKENAMNFIIEQIKFDFKQNKG